ncbi:unknown [Clostridium sp. CAG:356]|nr:unknown [Clostridium sp. CAG:356]
MMTQDECLQVEQNMILSNVEIRQISIKVETRKSKIINKKSVNLRKLINYRQ